MSAALAIVIACAIAMIVSQVFVVVVGVPLARVLRIAIDDAKIGVGPKLFTVTVAGTPVVVRLLWITASFAFRGMSVDTFEPPPAPLRAWPDVPPFERTAILVAHHLLPAILALPFLGVGGWWRALVSGVVDYPAAFYGSSPLLDLAAARFRDHGLPNLVALVMVKTLASNLYLFPMMLSMRLRKGAPAIDGWMKLHVLFNVAVMVVNIAWIVDFVRWVLR